MVQGIRGSFSLLAASLALVTGANAQTGLEIAVRPEAALLVQTETSQHLSVDLEVRNGTDEDVRLQAFEIRGFGPDERMVVWRRLEANGPRPGLETLGPLELAAGASRTLFNPVHTVPEGLDLARVRFDLTYQSRSGARHTASAELRPEAVRPDTSLILPVEGRTLWIYDGFGPLSHHRRVDLADPFNRDVMGMAANSQRYAVDLVVVDDQRRAFTGSPGPLEAWVGLGVPIRAPAAGIVVAAEGGMPDDMPFDEAALARNPLVMLGNYVLIDHENGTTSLLAHFREGTLEVAAGDRVAPGDPLGAMGRSGMGVGLVHLHYELRTDPDLMRARGLPFGFRDVVNADTGRPPAGGLLESGTFIRKR